jgi:hypothetical protein
MRPSVDWLESIEITCNEILDSYMVKEGQLMNVAFGGRAK